MGTSAQGAPGVPSPFENGASEVVNIDAVIDRLIIRYQRDAGDTLDRTSMVDHIYEHIAFVFNKNIGKCDIYSRVHKVIEYKTVLQALMNIPKIDQRTPAWYEARNNMITASDIAQSLGHGKFGTQRQFYEKKCGYEIDKFDSSMPALKWGIMFEPVAASAYSLKNEDVVVHEFGLLRHPSVGHLGASPDGISEMGIMIEIKCPWRRKITGEIPLQYYYQMQGQLDVCGLDECDYLECGFREYDELCDFVEDFSETEDFMGIILELKDGKGYEYVDASLWRDVDAQLAWMDAATKACDVEKTHFWRLHTYSVRRVYRDDQFIKDAYTKLADVWQNVVSFKHDKSRYDFYMGKTSITTHAAKRIALQASKVHMNIDTPSKTNAAQSNGFDGYAFVEDDDDTKHPHPLTTRPNDTKQRPPTPVVKTKSASNPFSSYAFIDE